MCAFKKDLFFKQKKEKKRVGEKVFFFTKW
jgi:hypothetical protein